MARRGAKGAGEKQREQWRSNEGREGVMMARRGAKRAGKEQTEQGRSNQSRRGAMTAGEKSLNDI